MEQLKWLVPGRAAIPQPKALVPSHRSEDWQMRAQGERRYCGSGLSSMKEDGLWRAALSGAWPVQTADQLQTALGLAHECTLLIFD